MVFYFVVARERGGFGVQWPANECQATADKWKEQAKREKNKGGLTRGSKKRETQIGDGWEKT